MRIHCWGSRGSFPVSGAEHVRYGGATSCVSVESGKGDLVVLDAGSGIHAFGRRIAPVAHERIIHLVFTHAHLDHVMGFPYFAPIYDERTTMHIYGCPCAADSMETAIRKLMRNPYFPVDFSALPAEIVFHEVSAEAFTVGSLRFTPARLNHPGGGCGYRIEEKGKSFVFMTDNELEYGKEGYDAEYFEAFCAGADLLIHDGEYTDAEYCKYETWGHSRYTDAVRLASAAGAKRLGLFHIHSHRTDDEMDAIVEDAKGIAAGRFECFGVGAGFEAEI